ncbi:outer membrane receptor protein involved in Fe transport [Novosphingobium chloroacetimidivorans]|uniref:Outer membrane receptor protein involved in Fe transport n=1 Tax=Novosphingobium chloroacetimidivorans TaxID=1428314 RepID=A0A7W7NX08_9SPHN|nr:TonB-dependent receptor [Novosphingobium chloroacetimidivorans]MBB4858695.1 outer membrane receptor protein involved in Fe transport [Novosphingobium chloroacetimidivorans]
MIKTFTMRSVLLAGSAMMLAGSPAMAQEAAPPAPGDSDASANDMIVVTGSRIRRPDYAAPNPVVSFDAAAIAQSGNTNVTTFLQRVPALTNSLDNTRTAGNAQVDGALGQVGLNLLDLRGLGVARTLVLVNGRRHVASQPNSAAVDINTIPTDLIERVDVLTGAASAVYGADGVSGVVNFVLRRDFDGVAARAQVGISQEGDAGNRFASIIAGRNFADGRANLTLAYEYNAEDPLANDDREYLRSVNRANFVNLNGYDPAVAGSYQKGPLRDIRYPDSSTYGIVDIGGVRYRGDGRIYTPGTVLENDGYSTGGDDTPVAGYIGDIFPKTERHAVNLLGRFEASEAFKISLEGKFVQSTARTFSGYGGNYPATVTLDNPFIPPTILAAAQQAGLTSIDINRNNFDIPRRGEENRRRTWRGVVDLSGRISDHATYDAYYTYGRTDVRATKLNDRLSDRFTAALDAVRDPATGQIVCRSASARAAGCVPVNTFGANTVDPASYDYYLFDPVSNARLEQHVVNASLSGDFGALFELPGGPVQFAFGGEYRRESSRFRPARELVDNVFYQFDEYVIPTASSGKFDVWEAFGEINLPLLKDRPFAHLLSVGAAGRYSDYSTVGSTKTYQFNGVWAPVEAVTLRGSYGQSVRAPNIAEVFRPRTGDSGFISDPCYLGARGDGTQFRAANCAALITAAGGNPATFTNANNPNANVNIPGAVQGNANLRAETARTWTAGLVLRPLPRLQVAVDWYDIRIKDAINTAGASTIAELCVDQPTTDNPFCDAISRQAGSGYIDGYIVQPENVAAFRTAGLEFNASYQIPTARIGTFDVRLVGGYLHRLEQIPTIGADVEDNRDRPFRPKYNLTFSPTWTLGELTVNYNLRWQNGVRRFPRVDTADNPSYVAPEYFRFKELWQHDIRAQYQVGEAFAFYAGVNNFTNQKPDIGFETNVPISPVGRYVYAGAKMTL